jgi:hypothetical protein
VVVSIRQRRLSSPEGIYTGTGTQVQVSKPAAYSTTESGSTWQSLSWTWQWAIPTMGGKEKIK